MIPSACGIKANWMVRALILTMSLTTTSSSMAEPLTKSQGNAILEELRQIRQLLERQTMPRPVIQQVPVPDPVVKVQVKGAPVQGKADAPLVMVMFTDYECPFCRRFEAQTLPELRKQFVDTGKLKLVMRNLPLDMHANAHRVAEALDCAAEQDKFWDFREKLGRANEPLDLPRMNGFAQEAGIDVGRLNDCLASKRFVKAVDESIAEAGQLGISGTPTFVIGREKNGAVEGVRVVGAMPYAVFEQKLKELAASENK